MSFNAIKVNVARQSRIVLTNATLKLEPGKICALLGPNGVGKSTLISVLAGEIDFQGGSVELDGQSIQELTALAQAQSRAVLPQGSSLSFDFDVNEVVAIGGYPFDAVKPSELDAWIEQSMVEADVADLKDRKYPELSGGEQQRVQLARVLTQCRATVAARSSAYLLLDEPLASLDPRHQRHVLMALQRFSRESAVGILIVMHDINLAAQWCDEVALMVDRTVFCQGSPREVLTQENLHHAYGLDMSVIEHPLLADKLLVLAP